MWPQIPDLQIPPFDEHVTALRAGLGGDTPPIRNT
jgi:hypothetical protein